MRRIVAICTLICFGAYTAFQPTPVVTAQERRSQQAAKKREVILFDLAVHGVPEVVANSILIRLQDELRDHEEFVLMSVAAFNDKMRTSALLTITPNTPLAGLIEICRQTGVRWIVKGSYDRFRAVQLVNLSLVDVNEGKVLATETERLPGKVGTIEVASTAKIASQLISLSEAGIKPLLTTEIKKPKNGGGGGAIVFLTLVALTAGGGYWAYKNSESKSFNEFMKRWQQWIQAGALPPWVPLPAPWKLPGPPPSPPF